MPEARAHRMDISGRLSSEAAAKGGNPPPGPGPPAESSAASSHPGSSPSESEQLLPARQSARPARMNPADRAPHAPASGSPPARHPGCPIPGVTSGLRLLERPPLGPWLQPGGPTPYVVSPALKFPGSAKRHQRAPNDSSGARNHGTNVPCAGPSRQRAYTSQPANDPEMTIRFARGGAR